MLRLFKVLYEWMHDLCRYRITWKTDLFVFDNWKGFGIHFFQQLMFLCVLDINYFLLFFFQWDQFSYPELNNFLKVLDREENECITQLQYKYKVMKRLIKQRLKEIKAERLKGSKPDKVVTKNEIQSEIKCDSGSWFHSYLHCYVK